MDSPTLLALAALMQPTESAHDSTGAGDIAIRLSLDLPAATPALGWSQEQAEGGPDPAPAKAFGAAGTTRFTIQSAFSTEFGGNNVVFGGFGFEHFIADDLCLVSQINGVWTDQEGPNAGGINGALLLRWHFLARDTWSLYAEAGAGLAWFTDDIPAGGTKFNFTPQAAVGVTFDIGDQNRAYVAVGWHHISNAQIFNENPGQDSAILHVGVSFSF